LALTRGEWKYYLIFALLAVFGGLLRKEGLELTIAFLLIQGIFWVKTVWHRQPRRLSGLLILILVPLFVIGVLKYTEIKVAQHGSTWRLTTKLKAVLEEHF